MTALIPVLTDHGFAIGFMLGIFPVGAVLFFSGIAIGRRGAQRDLLAYGEDYGELDRDQTWGGR